MIVRGCGTLEENGEVNNGNISRTMSSTNSIKGIRAAVSNVLNSKYAVLHDIVESHGTLRILAGELRSAGIIDKAITRNPTYHDIIDTFIAKLPLLRTIDDVETHCQKFIDALRSLGGSAILCADTLREEWIAVTKDLGYDHFMEKASDADDQLQNITRHLRNLAESMGPRSDREEHLKELANQMVKLTKAGEKSKVPHQYTSAIEQACLAIQNMISNMKDVTSSSQSQLMDEAINGYTKHPPDITALKVLLEKLMRSLEAAEQNYCQLHQQATNIIIINNQQDRPRTCDVLGGAILGAILVAVTISVYMHVNVANANIGSIDPNRLSSGSVIYAIIGAIVGGMGGGIGRAMRGAIVGTVVGAVVGIFAGGMAYGGGGAMICGVVCALVGACMGARFWSTRGDIYAVLMGCATIGILSIDTLICTGSGAVVGTMLRRKISKAYETSEGLTSKFHSLVEQSSGLHEIIVQNSQDVQKAIKICEDLKHHDEILDENSKIASRTTY